MSVAGGALITGLVVDHESVGVAGLQPRGDLVQVAFVEAPVEVGCRLLEGRHTIVERLEGHLQVRLRVAGGNRRLVGELRLAVPQTLEAGLGERSDAPLPGPVERDAMPHSSSFFGSRRWIASRRRLVSGKSSSSRPYERMAASMQVMRELCSDDRTDWMQ